MGAEQQLVGVQSFGEQGASGAGGGGGVDVDAAADVGEGCLHWVVDGVPGDEGGLAAAGDADRGVPGVWPGVGMRVTPGATCTPPAVRSTRFTSPAWSTGSTESSSMRRREGSTSVVAQ